jgi:ankyrin repeat protein
MPAQTPESDPNGGPEPPLASATSPDVVAALLAAGADPNAHLRFGRFVVDAIAHDHVELSAATRAEMLTLLREAGADLDAPNEHGGITTLYRVASDGFDAVAVEALIAAGADPLRSPGALNAVCFCCSWAPSADVDRIVQMMVAAGVDLDQEDDAGFRPIHSAVSADRYGPGFSTSDGIGVAAVHALVLHRAAIDVPFPDDGFTPLHCAAAQGSAAAVDILLGAGADPREPAPDGHTPVALAQAAIEQTERMLANATEDRIIEYFRQRLDDARACARLF